MKLIISLAMALMSGATVLFAESAGPSFDGVSGNAGFSTRELLARSKADTDVRPPVPSTVPVSNELINFWSNLETDGLDKLCKVAQLKLNQNVRLVNVVGLGGGVKRYLKSFPDHRLALVDEIELKLGLSLNQAVLQVPGLGSLSVGISGGVEGKSVVVRPLESERYCKELGTLVKFYDAKTVLPITAKRIVNMQKGEIWKLPVVVRYSISGSVGTPAMEGVVVSIGAGYTKERKPSVSLYRMDENDLRLRIRIDHVTVKSLGVSASTMEIPAGDIGILPGEDFLSKTVDRNVARQINRFIAFKLGYNEARTSGKKLLLEFHLNPNDAEQVAGLVEFLEGDFDTIRKFISMGLSFETFAEEAAPLSGAEIIEDLADSAGSAVNGTAAFAGTDHYDGQSDNLNVNIPVAYSHRHSVATGYHRYQALKKNGSIVHIQQRTRVSNGDMLNLPFAGTRMRHNSEKNIYVVNKQSMDGKVTGPVLLFQQYEGLVGKEAGRARSMLHNANAVLEYAGRRGNGVTYENMVPPSIFPLLPPEGGAAGGDEDKPETDRRYKAVVMSFKLAFSEKAVQEIIFTAPELILKAYMNVMRETAGPVAAKAMDLFTISVNGKVEYDAAAMRARLGVTSDHLADVTNPMNVVRSLARAAAKFLEKIAGVRAEPDWKGQAERLAKAASSGDMKYEDFLKVVIQLVDTKDISSDIYIHADKRVKGEPDVTQNYTMFNNRDNGYDSTIADVTAMRERFAEPTDLTD